MKVTHTPAKSTLRISETRFNTNVNLAQLEEFAKLARKLGATDKTLVMLSGGTFGLSDGLYIEIEK